MKLYPYGSFNVHAKIKDDNDVPIVTTYAANDLMTDATAGKGIARVTIYDRNENIISDANGQLLEDRPMYWRGSGVAVYNVAPGVLPDYAGSTLTARPFFGVKDANGDIDWREMEEVTISISKAGAYPNMSLG